MEKPVLPLKNIVDALWTGDQAVIDPLVPAVIAAWIQTVPESLRNGITMEGIREHTLHLSVSNPVVGQQFQFLKDSIREKMNVILGAAVIKRIQVKAGPPFAPNAPAKGKRSKTERSQG